MLKQYRLRDYNFRLVLWVLALSVIGILLVGSAKASLQPRQTIGVIAGAVMMIIVSMFDFSWILNFYWILYVLNLGMLAAVLVFGNSSHGAQRWISIGGFTFQPAELSKIILIIFFAQYFMKHENDLNKPKIFIRSVLLIILPLALIIAQPDLKDTIIIFLLFAIMYFIAGLSLKTIGIILAIVIPAAVIFLFAVTQTDSSGNGLLKSYQRQRIMAFLNPNDSEYSDDSTQQENSVIAIGSGELSGKGLNNSDVSSANKGNFISEIQTDFIFAVAGEELGFLGSAGIIILLLLIALECILTAMKAKNLSGTLICCGMAALISLQSFINIGVATKILPNTGTPLPFVSYGLTSLLSNFLGIGLVLNVSLQGKIRVTPRAARRKKTAL